jgi:polyketide cyclase/dehydrase/lipid transport protein
MLALVLLALVELALHPAPPPAHDPSWQTIKVVDGVTLRRAPSDRAAPWGLGEGEIVAPLAQVVAHLTDFATLPRWAPRIAEVRVLERGANEALVYFRLDLPWPLSDRDWTVRYHWGRTGEPGERWVMTWSDANDRGPPPGKAVRVTAVRGSWELWPRGCDRTFGRYLFLAELGGRLPRSAVEQTAWKQPLQTFRGVRAATKAAALTADPCPSPGSSGTPSAR